MKKTINGFSLAELVVVMTIIGILMLSLSKISYNSQIESQNATLFTNNISSNIELLRNNALLGKGITNGTEITYPSKRVIKVVAGATGGIAGFYSTGGELTNYNFFHTQDIPNSMIRQVKCLNTTKTSFQTGSEIDIEFSGNQLNFSGCTAPNNAILDINLRHTNIFKTVRINSITGLVEKF